MSSWLAEGWTWLRGVPGGPHQKTAALKNSVSEKLAVTTNNNFLIPNWGLLIYLYSVVSDNRFNLC